MLLFVSGSLNVPGKISGHIPRLKQPNHYHTSLIMSQRNHGAGVPAYTWYRRSVPTSGCGASNVVMHSPYRHRSACTAQRIISPALRGYAESDPLRKRTGQNRFHLAALSRQPWSVHPLRGSPERCQKRSGDALEACSFRGVWPTNRQSQRKRHQETPEISGFSCELCNPKVDFRTVSPQFDHLKARVLTHF